MKKRLNIFILVGLLMSSFQSNVHDNNESLAVLIVKLKYQSYGIVGFGGSLKVRNNETNEVYESRSKMGFNPYVIIENLPIGNYTVEEVKIISGPNVLTLRNTPDFNTFKLDSSKVYYLGSYSTKKVPPIMKLNFKIFKTRNDSSKEIVKQLNKRSENYQYLNIDFKQRLFVKDTTAIEILKNH